MKSGPIIRQLIVALESFRSHAGLGHSSGRICVYTEDDTEEGRSGLFRPGTITSLGKNRGAAPSGHLSFENRREGRRVAGELYWRKPELKEQD